MNKDRKEELIGCFEGIDDNAKMIIYPLIDNVVFIEQQLDDLKKLPFVNINPTQCSRSRRQRARCLKN